MNRCTHCGGKLRRIHRTFMERFVYLAIYQCRQCQRAHYMPRHYRFHFGPYARCPRCGTFRLTKLREPDHIDRMQSGFLNFAERVARGKLFHCKICRLQFYDRRSSAPEPAPVPGTAGDTAAPPATQPLEQ